LFHPTILLRKWLRGNGFYPQSNLVLVKFTNGLFSPLRPSRELNGVETAKEGHEESGRFGRWERDGSPPVSAVQ